jgi:hypothetical protein
MRFNAIDTLVTVRNEFSLFRTKNGAVTESKFSTTDPNIQDYAQAFAVANQAFHYGIRFHANPGANLKLGFSQGSPNDRVRYEMRVLDTRSVIKSTGWRQVNQLSDLEAATDAVWFKQGDTIHLRFTLIPNAWIVGREILVGY